MAKKLRRGHDRMIGGVCSGIAERYDTDATAVRLLWALLTVFTALVPGILIYVICWVVIPKPR